MILQTHHVIEGLLAAADLWALQISFHFSYSFLVIGSHWVVSLQCRREDKSAHCPSLFNPLALTQKQSLKLHRHQCRRF